MAYKSSMWESVAVAWREWEHLGMTMSSLRPFLPKIKSPVLVIGAGQGVVVEALMQSGYEVVGIDGAQTMIDEARKRRGLDLKLALGEALPFDNQSFATVIFATGVLYSKDSKSMPLVTEALRVLKMDGQLLAGFFSPSKRTLSISQEIGYLKDSLQQPQRLLEIWAAERNESRWIELVAQWQGCSQYDATNRVQRYQSILYAIYADWERFALKVRECGHDPKSIFQEIVKSGSPVGSMDIYIALFHQHGLTEVETHWESEISTLTLMGTKK